MKTASAKRVTIARSRRKGMTQTPTRAIIEHMFDDLPGDTSRRDAVRPDRAPGLAVHPTTSWPSPAQDYDPGPIDGPGGPLVRALFPRPGSTFVLRTAGTGLRSIGIADGDELIVDRALDPAPGLVVVVVVEYEHRVGILTWAGANAGAGAGADFGAGADQVGDEPPGDESEWLLRTDDSVLPLPADAQWWGVATVVIHHLVSRRPPTRPVGPATP